MKVFEIHYSSTSENPNTHVCSGLKESSHRLPDESARDSVYCCLCHRELPGGEFKCVCAGKNGYFSVYGSAEGIVKKCLKMLEAPDAGKDIHHNIRNAKAVLEAVLTNEDACEELGVKECMKIYRTLEKVG